MFNFWHVSVISGTTNSANISVGAGDSSTGPTFVAVNEATNRVYVDHVFQVAPARGAYDVLRWDSTSWHVAVAWTPS